MTCGPRTATSPTVPVGNRRPVLSRIAISRPVATPTEPGLRNCGGNGLLDICEVSVIEYAATTGTLNIASSALRTAGGSAAEPEQMNRNDDGAVMSWAIAACLTIDW